jgi:hypothetical protein
MIGPEGSRRLCHQREQAEDPRSFRLIGSVEMRHARIRQVNTPLLDVIPITYKVIL